MGSSERSSDLGLAVPAHDARETDIATDSASGLHQRRAIGASTTTADKHNISVTSAGSPPVDVETAVSNEGQGHGKDVNNDAGAAADGVAAQDEQQFADVSYLDITKQFFILGWTAFGGPAAHIGLFQKVMVLLVLCLAASSCSSAHPVVLAASTQVLLQAHYDGASFESNDINIIDAVITFY